MFKGAISLCPIFVFATSLACVFPPSDRGEATPAVAGSSSNDNAVVSLAHVLDPDDSTNPLHCVQKNTAAESPVSAMTACVYEFSTTNPGALRYREIPVPHETVQRYVLQQIVSGASK
jgi:hypothetical protein